VNLFVCHINIRFRFAHTHTRFVPMFTTITTVMNFKAKDDEGGLSGLRSDKSVQRLEQISALRTRGIGETIDLPQLVVCGDQSAGKSSVLEGISGIPFPRDEGVCTKFATVSEEHHPLCNAHAMHIMPRLIIPFLSYRR